MMRAYLDESGHESKGWVFVAGFLGTEDQWTDFVPKWKIGLGPQRKSLHMSRLRWKNDRTRRLLARLGPIPHECGLEAVIGGVRVADYDDLVVGTEDEHILKGYMAALTPLVLNVLRGIPKDERVEFVFEEQREYHESIDMVMAIASRMDRPHTMTSDGLPKIAKWGFVPKGSTVMTDPADYIAFALREDHIDHGSKKAQWSSPILSSGSRNGIGLIMNREQARRAVLNAQRLFKETWGE
jgi:hypothetical protein